MFGPVHECSQTDKITEEKLPDSKANSYFYGMIFQQVLIGLIFAGALGYIGSTVFKAFQSKTGCASGCGKCGAIDFAKIEQQLKEKQKTNPR